MTLLLSLLGVDALLGGTFTVLHGLEHLLGILLAHAALLLLLLLLLLILVLLILVLVLFVLILLILILVLFILILIFVLVLILILVLILVLVLVLILIVLVLVLVLILIQVLLLLLELGKTQVLTRLVVIRVAAQGMLVELHGLVILLAAVCDITQVIAGLAAQLLVLCALGKVGKDALGLLHGILVVILLRGDATLTHQGSGEIELSFLAGRIGLQCLAVLDFGLGIAFFLI